MKILTIINQKYPSFTKSDRLISDFIIENFENVPAYTLKELSETIGVGEATIIRYCKKIGYTSLHEFRFDIVRDLENNKEVPLVQSSNYKQIFEGTKHQIDHTFQLNKHSLIKDLAKLVDKEVGLYFFGIGHSGLVAEMGAYRMARHGRKATAVSDLHYMAITSSVLEKDDLVIAISLSGQSPELIRSVKIAQSRGAYVCAITSHETSELAKIADKTLISTTDQIFALPDGASVDGIVTQLLLIEAIIKEFSNLHREETRRKSERITLSFASERRK